MGYRVYQMSGTDLGRLGRAPEPENHFSVLLWLFSLTGEGKEFLYPGDLLQGGCRMPPCASNQVSFPHPPPLGRWQSYESQSSQSFVSDIKRHSEGTFTSDFTRYLDKMKAKDFVHWLINTKRFR